MNTEATELLLYISSDGNLYRRLTQPIRKNLALKKARKEYDHEKAIKAWLRLVVWGAKQYKTEHGSMTDSWSRMFDSESRRQVAEELTAQFESAWRLGEFRDLLPKKYQSK